MQKENANRNTTTSHEGDHSQNHDEENDDEDSELFDFQFKSNYEIANPK